MRLLALFFEKIFGKYFTLFTDIFSVKAAQRLAYIAFCIGLVSGLIAAINAILNTLVKAIPEPIQIGASWIMPDNFDTCIYAYFGAQALIWLFHQKTTIGFRAILT